MALHIKWTDEYPLSRHPPFRSTIAGLALAFRVRQPAALSFDTHIEPIIRTRPMHLAELAWRYSRTLSDEHKGARSTPLQTGSSVWPKDPVLFLHVGAYSSTTLGVGI